ncbi:hypothetical protein C1Y35_07330 [Pseudomonas sp. GW456-L14]|nr:hypothetical protein C1Y35_07330 [Pseudomonas sp. GW456-L14]PMY54701.1 hypothetical protein C1Y34_16740 [Pseudomonas sp. GW456-L12]
MAALGHAALKTGSECSCRSLHSASSPVFALPDLRSPTFRTGPSLAVQAVGRLDVRQMNGQA